MSIGLKTGLEYFIKRVENLPDDTKFEMPNYKRCVIGQTFGWDKFDADDDNYNIAHNWNAKENYILSRRFGIKKLIGNFDRFSRGSIAHYTDRQWSVIRLFTGAIGYELTKQEWLEMAKEQLEQMK